MANPVPEGATDPYPRRDRRRDIRHGRRDGRKRIPTYAAALEANGDGRDVGLTTPYEEWLKAGGQHEINERLRDFLRRSDGLCRRRAQLESELARDEIAVKYGRELLEEAQAELTESDLLPRSPQEVELGRRDADSLRGRRAAERRRRIDDAVQELERRRGAVADRHRQIEEARGLIEVEFTHAQARGRRLADLCLVRISTYWDALVQRHPDGANLATERPAVRFDPPAWVDADRWDATEPPEETGP